MQSATPQRNHSRRAKPDLSHPIFGFMKRLRSATQTGRKLHLDAEHARLLLSDQVYQVLTTLEAMEIRKACQAASDNDNSLETSGSGNVPASEPGASAGSNIIPLDAASRGASLLLREEAALMRRRRQH